MSCSDVEHLVITHTALEAFAKNMSPLPDEAMGHLVQAIYVVREKILTLLPTSSERIRATVLAPFIEQLVSEA
ncbi:hypothetical protein [Mesorhizobium sp. M0674]|uniref:hypothetical protein n=1 Tax=unclassified Mesorhizobium TaxID=325217 RepID=UPI00333B2A3D